MRTVIIHIKQRSGDSNNPIIISTERPSRPPRALDASADEALTRRTRFEDLPIPARLLLAVGRMRGKQPKATIAERYVLDTLGRIPDAGPERRQTIEAVNLLAEVLLSDAPIKTTSDTVDRQWLSAIENLVLCVLWKARDGKTYEAANLMQHWLGRASTGSVTTAATRLCDSECFKRGGPHVFTPRWSASVSPGPASKHRSVTYTSELSLGELTLLNAIRLRMRTLRYTGISEHVVPLLSKHLALPNIEALLDAHLIEVLQHGVNTPDIRCLCCSDISADEAQFLAPCAAFASGNAALIEYQLDNWLPPVSVQRVQAHTVEFQHITREIGTTLPIRDWDLRGLRARPYDCGCCGHVNEPSMIP